MNPKTITLLLQAKGSFILFLLLSFFTFLDTPSDLVAAESPAYYFGDCEADAGTFDGLELTLISEGAIIEATPGGDAVVPDGFTTIYVLTSGEELIIQDVNSEPSFTVDQEGIYTIHTLVYDPETLDLSIVMPGETTGFDVNALLIQGGGSICASLDVAGARFTFDETEECTADAGTLMTRGEPCLIDGEFALVGASRAESPTVPEGFQLVYVLTSGEELVIEQAGIDPAFEVTEPGLYTVHTLVYDPETLDLGIVVPGETTGFDVNALLIQGGGDICGALDVAGASYEIEACPVVCEAAAGTLNATGDPCLEEGEAMLTAEEDEAPAVPAGFEVLYVLTSGEELVIEQVNSDPSFTVAEAGLYTIHTLVYDPETLDLGIVVPGETTGFDVNALLIQGGGNICGALDVAGASFEIEACPVVCEAAAGTLNATGDPCLEEGEAMLTAEEDEAPAVPAGFEVLYVLTSGEELVIEQVNSEPSFTVAEAGLYTIHTLVYDPETLDLSIVVPGETTGFDVNALLIQGGGDICGALDVAGASFEIETCPVVCEADAGTLMTRGEPCLTDEAFALVGASRAESPTVPEGFQLIYVLTSGEELVIEQAGIDPAFEVTEPGLYTVHTLVYDPETLDLGIVVPGETTGFDVNALLIQGGGDICGALDVAGASYEIEACPVVCEATAGTLSATGDPCLEEGEAMLTAEEDEMPTVPAGFEVLYVLTSGEELVIEQVNSDPSFTVAEPGLYTVHTLVYDPETLDLGIVVPGETTGFDVNALLIQGGGNICGALDVAGASFEIEDCPVVCEAAAGTLSATGDPCLEEDEAMLTAEVDEMPTVPAGFEVLYVLTSGEELVIEQVNSDPSFAVTEAGLYTIHTLVYDPETLDLSIVVPGETTGFDVNALLIQGGGDICGALDVAGASFEIETCPPVCEADAGTLHPRGEPCLRGGEALISASRVEAPVVPEGFQVLYVLTSGEDLVIEQAGNDQAFTVTEPGLYTIHTLVYNPETLDLSIVVPGETTGFDVNALLIQGGGEICAALDVEGASHEVASCGDQLRAYPNPVRNQVTLDLSPEQIAPHNALQARSSAKELQVEVINANGSLVDQQTIPVEAQQQQLDFSRFSAGLYTIRVLLDGKLVQHLRITKVD